MKQQTTRRNPRQDKRGTVLIFAIGALAVISIVAVSYVSIVRIERNSAAAAASQNNRGESVDVVINRIRDLLAADLFGNKIVTTAVPQEIGFDPLDAVRVWPKMFEDGEYTDYPSVDRIDTTLSNNPGNFTFDTRFFGNRANPPAASVGADLWTLDIDDRINAADQIGRRYQVANADDAWLATTEPEYHDPGLTGVSEIPWRNITNLRSAYEWVQREGGRDVRNREDQLGLWVRGDGRFVDLAQFFNKTPGVAGQPASNIPDFGDAGRILSVLDPEFGTVYHDGAGVLDTTLSGNSAEERTSVYQFQMMFMDEFGPSQEPAPRAGNLVPRDPTTPDPMNPPQRNAKDDRFWADTDGDLRPDARWQEVDELGNLANLTWVVAARIIDASSLINVNSSIGFDNLGSTIGLDENQIGAGRTPADIDLYRLLERSEDGGGYYNYDDVDTADLSDAFLDEHLPNGLGLTEPDPMVMQSIYRELSTDRLVDGQIVPRLTDGLPYAPDNPINPLDFTVSGRIPTRYLRSAYYEFVGSGPTDHGIAAAITIPTRDIYDLMSFWGTNNSSVVSKLEQRIDSPDLFPQEIADYNPSGMPRLGPLRSLEDSRVARISDQGNPKPSTEELRSSVRNAITTVSGVGTFSPVPVLNEDERYDEQYFMEKINLRDLAELAETPDPLDLSMLRRALRGEHIRDTFASFVWALAPFATDQPYSQHLATQRIFGLQGASVDFSNHDFHYGGSNASGNSLAQRVLNITQSGANMTGEGPGFAIRTAAALTANLIDAIDAPVADSGGVETDEPTVLRILRRTPASGRITDQPMDGEFPDANSTIAIELGLNFPQGEVDPNLIREPSTTIGSSTDPVASSVYITNPDSFTDVELNRDVLDGDGLTVVGLERQPFFVQAQSYIYYEALGQPVSNPVISTASDAKAYALFFEIHNPWPEAIEINQVINEPEYWIVIPNGNSATDLSDLGATDGDIRLALPQITINPGQSIVCWYAYPFTLTSPGSFDLSDPAMRFLSKLFFNSDSALSSRVDPMTSRLRSVDEVFTNMVPGSSNWTDVLELNDSTTGFATTNPVLLTRRLRSGIQTNEADWNTPQTDFYEVVVDKLRPTGATFPGVDTAYNDIVTNIEATYGNLTNYLTLPRASGGAEYGAIDPMRIDGVGGDTINLAMMETRTINRNSTARQGESPESLTASGWPVALLENPQGTSVQVYNHRNVDGLGIEHMAAVWLPTDIGDPDPSLLPGVIPDVYLLNADFIDDGGDSLAPIAYNIRSLAEIDSLLRPLTDGITTDTEFSAYQMYVPNAPLNFVGEIGRISTFAHLCLNHNMRNIDSWITVGEQMYAARTRSTVLPGDESTNADPYMGVLDPTTNLFGQTLADPFALVTPIATDIPENLTVPLATRVFDCFEALRTVANLKQGVINVNTASARVLEMLPFIKPGEDYFAPNVPNPLPQGVGGGAPSLRANAIVEYRDRLLSPEANESGAALSVDFTQLGITDTNGLGARLRDSSAGSGTGKPGAGGVSALGELAIMDDWGTAGAGPPKNPIPGTNLMAALGSNQINDGNDTMSFEPNFIDLTPSTTLLGSPDINPEDDPEERMRIFDAISNLTSVRSDVYLAWFIVRGYDPDEIERIPLNLMSVEDSMVDVDNPFEPAFERRYLVVLDRSNVRTPTDRPRVLLRFRLPDIR